MMIKMLGSFLDNGEPTATYTKQTGLELFVFPEKQALIEALPPGICDLFSHASQYDTMVRNTQKLHVLF